jgi:hypothetical protein
MLNVIAAESALPAGTNDLQSTASLKKSLTLLPAR